MTNAFDWRRYTDEEREARAHEPDTTIRRRNAATKNVKRIREDHPSYGAYDIICPKDK